MLRFTIINKEVPKWHDPERDSFVESYNLKRELIYIADTLYMVEWHNDELYRVERYISKEKIQSSDLRLFKAILSEEVR